MQNEEQKVLEKNTLTDVSPGEIIIGTLVTINSNGQPLVEFSENPEENPLIAVSTLGVNKSHEGRQVALLFANGDTKKPVIMGLIHNPLHDIIENFEVDPGFGNEDKEIWPEDDAAKKDKVTLHESTIDGKRIVIEGQEEIVLKCGDASITLTKAGKIIIRGKYILNRSSGVNRIMGGSVQVN